MSKSVSSKPAWKAGVSKVDISPSEPIWLAGWAARTEPSQGVSQRIWVKALALQEGARRVVWVSSDLLGFSKSMTDALAARAKKKFGLERQQIILNASHNHSGPVTGDVLSLYFQLTPARTRVVERYTTWLLDRVIAAIGLALADLAPADLAFGQGLAGIGVNRRRARFGGRCLPTVVDQDVPVLSVRGRDGKLRAVVFGYSCHTTCVNDGTINGDYAGWAQAALEQRHPGATALFMAGCGGDINPLPRHVAGLGQAYGEILATAVDVVLAGKMAAVSGPLRAAFTYAQLPFETPPTRQQLQAMLPGRSGLGRREIQRQLSLLRGGDRRPKALAYPIHVWQLGDSFKLIALSSEPVSDYALRFKAAYGWENVWVSGYNDDYYCYIPSLRIWREGGYEGTTGMMECDLPGPFASSVEEIIAAAVDELWQQTSSNPIPRPRPSRHE